MWTDWPLQRVLYLFLGLAFMSIFIQVTLFHLRQNFWHAAQWFPVIATPLLSLSALLLVWHNASLFRWAFAGLSVAGGLIGMVGTYYHIAGVAKRVEGFNLNNLMVGPPPMLPMMVIALSALGLVALSWV